MQSRSPCPDKGFHQVLELQPRNDKYTCIAAYNADTKKVDKDNVYGPTYKYIARLHSVCISSSSLLLLLLLLLLLSLSLSLSVTHTHTRARSLSLSLSSFFGPLL